MRGSTELDSARIPVLLLEKQENSDSSSEVYSIQRYSVLSADSHNVKLLCKAGNELPASKQEECDATQRLCQWVEYPCSMNTQDQDTDLILNTLDSLAKSQH